MYVKFPSNNNKYLNSHSLDLLSKEQLLDYNYFYQKNFNKLNKKINSCKFRPHKLWNNWNKNYFLSISNNKILDLTSFGSEENKSYKISNRGKNINIFNYNVNIQKKGEYIDGSSLKKNAEILLNKIQKYFKNSKKDFKNYIVIGAGNAYEVVSVLNKFPKVKVAIIDLPEIINSGYLTIKNYNEKIKITLPDKAKKFSKSNSQINFYFPNQINLIDGNFDFGNNIGSFQEMDIKVVNNYLNFIYKKLNKNGLFVSINSERSRYIKNNSVNNYKINKFEILKVNDVFRYQKSKILVLKKS